MKKLREVTRKKGRLKFRTEEKVSADEGGRLQDSYAKSLKERRRKSDGRVSSRGGGGTAAKVKSRKQPNWGGGRIIFAEVGL